MSILPPHLYIKTLCIILQFNLDNKAYLLKNYDYYLHRCGGVLFITALFYDII